MPKLRPMFFERAQFRSILMVLTLTFCLINPFTEKIHAEPLSAAYWEASFSPRGVTLDVKAIAVLDQDVYVGGNFITAGDVEAHYIARWNVSSRTWSSLGTLPYSVQAIAVAGQSVYAAAEGRLYRWNISAQSWEELGNAMGSIYALAAAGDSLYVGGNFSNINAIPLVNIARWRPAVGAWEAVGDIGFVVFSLAVQNDTIFAGGQRNLNGAAQARLAAWSTAAPAWTPVGGDLFGSAVHALAFNGDTLVAGGVFTQTGTLKANNIATWRDGQWQALGKGLDGAVRSISAGSLGVFAAGNFVGTDETPWVSLYYAARWDANSASWKPLDTGLTSSNLDPFDPQDCHACAIAAGSNQLFVGGKFTSAGNVTAFNVAAWDLSSGKWQPLYAGSQGNGLDNEALAMAVIGTDVYVGGWFTRAGPIPAAYIAKWDSLTGQWSTLGSGLDSGVYALEVSGTDLYVGGHFTKAGGADAYHIARWNTATHTWSPLGSGDRPGLSDYVETLAMDGEKLYVGGWFDQINNGPQTDHMAIWHTAAPAWEAVPDAGLKDAVFTILPRGQDVYVGGRFYKNGGSKFSSIALWHPADNTWHELAGGLDGTVNTLAAYGQDILAGGTFLSGLQRWNVASQSWAPLPGGGFSGGFYYGSIIDKIIVRPDGDIYAAGTFDHAGGSQALNIAQYSARYNLWRPLEGGFNTRAHTLGLVGKKLYAGGEFSLAGSSPSAKLAAVPTAEINLVFVPELKR